MKVNRKAGLENLTELVLFRVLSISKNKFDSAKPCDLRNWLTNTQTLLAKERRRGQSNHYRYDLNRHIALVRVKQALQAKLGL